MSKIKKEKGVDVKTVEKCGNIYCGWNARICFSYGKCKSSIGECFAYRKVGE